MFRKEEFRFPSRDGHTQLYGVRWLPTGEIKGLVHLIHGLNDYMGLYDLFASALAASGYLCFGHDLLGHGLSAEYEEDLGYFGSERGDDYVLADILMLTRFMQENYPEKPLVLLGQGMGSYFVRRFLFTWPTEANGAVLLANNSLKPWQVRLNSAYTTVAALFRKERYGPSRVSRAILRQMNGHHSPHRSAFAWLAEDLPSGGSHYNKHVPTLRLYRNLNHTLGILAREESVLEMSKDAPLLIVGSEQDPLGKHGVEARRLASLFKQGGIRYVSLKNYPGEPDPEDLEADILSWLDACLYLLDRQETGTGN